MRGAYARLHYTAPGGLGALLIAIAMVVRQGFSLIGDKALLLAVFVLVTSPVLSHVTARAARIRELGDVVEPGPEDAAMSFLQAVALVAVAGGGTAVVLTREPTRQVIITGFFGLLLAILFFVFQAPDVALSQIVVGRVALPVMVLLTLAKLRTRARADET